VDVGIAFSVAPDCMNISSLIKEHQKVTKYVTFRRFRVTIVAAEKQ